MADSNITECSQGLLEVDDQSGKLGFLEFESTYSNRFILKDDLNDVELTNCHEKDISLKSDDIDSGNQTEDSHSNISHDSLSESSSQTLIKDVKEFMPVVKLEKLDRTTIYNLTKHRDHQKNIRTFVKEQRYKRRTSLNLQQKSRRQSFAEESRQKMLEIQKFLEYNTSQYHSREIDFFKPRRNPLFDIDRYSTDRSETSSVCGSDRYSLRRSLSIPERFTYTHQEATKRAQVVKETFNSDESFTVEKICSINLLNNEIIFLVKWENYSEQQNSWEPLKHVRECEETVEEFIRGELSGMEEHFQQAMAGFLDDQKEMIDLYWTKPKTEVLNEIREKFDPFLFRCSQLVYFIIKNHQERYKKFICNFAHQVVLNYFKDVEIKQNESHLKIRDEIMMKEDNVFPLYIENNVDFTTFEPFNYTKENILPADLLTFSDSNSLGCNCRKLCDENSKLCCPNIKKSKFAYKEFKKGIKLKLRNQQMIFECGDKCKCSADCMNRVTQQPRKHPLKIFKTENGRGWGLKAVKPIPRGSYIIDYIGEIINQEESIKRGKIYDQIGRSYLFDLDFNEKNEAIYTIDAAKYGNLSRLINHSCEPNCRIWPVTCNHEVNSLIYKLCFFADRHIKAGEELLIDYSGGTFIQESDSDNDDENDEGDLNMSCIARKHRMLDKCKCGSTFCKGYVFL